MAEQTTYALAPGARCFVCFEEGVGAAWAPGGAPGALVLTRCGCLCLTLFACPECMWRLVEPPGEVAETPRDPQMQCKVCLGMFSDAAVLMACRHVVERALAVGVDPGAEQQALYEARHKPLFGVMETLRKIEDANAALQLARRVVAEQEAFVGAQHTTAVYFRWMLGNVLLEFEHGAEARRIFNECSRAYKRMVQTWDAEVLSASDRKWKRRTLRSQVYEMMSAVKEVEAIEAGAAGMPRSEVRFWAQDRSDQKKYIEEQLLEAHRELRRMLGRSHPDSMFSVYMYVSTVVLRMLRDLGGSPARTRSQHEQLHYAIESVDYGLSIVDSVRAKQNTEQGLAFTTNVSNSLLQFRAMIGEGLGASPAGASGVA